MLVGDIVYFREKGYSIYGKHGGSYFYYFVPGHGYRIDSINYTEGFYGSTTGTVTNLEDGTSHFLNSDLFDKIITKDEWRKLQLEKLFED